MNNFLEQIVFELAKDSEISTAQEFKARFYNYDINHSEVYKKVINYRISKYGNSFNSRYANVDRKRVKQNSEHRKYAWRKRNGKV